MKDADKTPKPAAAPMGRPGGGGPMMGGGPAPEKPKNFKATLNTLFDYLKPYRIKLVLVILFAIASTIFAIVSPKILGNVTTKIVEDYQAGQIYDRVTSQFPQGKVPPTLTGKTVLEKLPDNVKKSMTDAQREDIEELNFSGPRPGIDYTYIARICLILIGLYLISALFNFIQSWLMTDVTQQVTYGLRRDLSTKINKLPLGYFDKRTYGEVLSRVTNDVDTVSQNLNQSLTQIVSAITMLIGILAIMLTISWQLTLLALLILPVSIGLITFVVKLSQKFFTQQQVQLGEINGHVEEMFSGHLVMKVFNGQQRSVAKFRKINDQLFEGAWKSQFLSGLLMPIMAFVTNLGYVGVAVLGGWLAVNGRISIGDIQAFIQYMNQFTQPITQVANAANVMQSTTAAAERVFEFLDEKEEIAEIAESKKLGAVQGEVKFENVKFGYDKEKMIIKDFTATAEAGKRIAIVGPTGAGKTTMVNLLMRFYDVNSGSIKIDGADVRDMKRAELRRMFGMVLQDTWLFNGTLMENIAYGKPNATEKEVRAAAIEAHADHFIRALPDGYQTVLNEEADNISAGERQLITIARAMLADPPMLILDEATSSVDTRTETLIQKAMDRLMKGRTSFVIAHRLSTIRNADLILVMKDGNIVEHGTHTQLLAKDGFYANLYNSQFAVA